MSRKTTTATDTIGKITMRTKNSVRRVRKLMGHPPGHLSVLRTPPRDAVALALSLAVRGAIAQLGERLDRTQEGGGSSPPSSTRWNRQRRCGIAPSAAPVLPMVPRARVQVRERLASF